MLYIYAIIAVLAFTTLLFWAKWSNKKAELKTAKENHTKSELEKTKEIRKFNTFYEYIRKINKFGSTNDIKNIKDVSGPLKTELETIVSAYGELDNVQGAIVAIRSKLEEYYPDTKRIHIQVLLDQLIKEATNSAEKSKNIENILKSLSRLRGTKMYDPNSVEGTISKMILELGKRKQIIESKNKIIQKREGSLHVAHQKNYEYRQTLITNKLLKPRVKKKK